MDKSGLFVDDRRTKLANDLAEIIDDLEFLHTLACDECAVTANDTNNIIEKLENLEIIDGK